MELLQHNQDLYIQYIEAGTDNETQVFSNSENIIADASITHTTTYATNVASATTHTTAVKQEHLQK